MDSDLQEIAGHYACDGLLDRILEGLRQSGVNLRELRREDLGPVDEFHVRGAEVSAELAAALDPVGLRVLDVGCGLGGPARLLADRFACRVSGIDLSPDFIWAARELTRLTGLDRQVDFYQGNALELPFEAETFDIAWTQHVQMNISDKERFYREMQRVLHSGGRLAYYDLFATGSGPVSYPMPWASSASQSFLATRPKTHELLNDLGFRLVSHKDETAAGVAFFKKVIDRVRRSGPPPVGLHLIMGKSTLEKLGNLTMHLDTGLLELETAIWALK